MEINEESEKINNFDLIKQKKKQYFKIGFFLGIIAGVFAILGVVHVELNLRLLFYICLIILVTCASITLILFDFTFNRNPCCIYCTSELEYKLNFFHPSSS